MLDETLQNNGGSANVPSENDDRSEEEWCDVSDSDEEILESEEENAEIEDNNIVKVSFSWKCDVETPV